MFWSSYHKHKRIFLSESAVVKFSKKTEISWFKGVVSSNYRMCSSTDGRSFFFKRDPKGDLLWSLPWIAHVMNMSENYWHNWIEPDLVSCIMQSSISLKLSLIFRSWRGWLVNSCNWPIFLSWEDYREKRFTHLISRRPNQKLFSPAELQCGAIVNGGHLLL